MNDYYKYTSHEQKYILFLNKYFSTKEAMEIAKLKCEYAKIANRETKLISCFGYGIWLKKIFPNEFKQGVESYKNQLYE